MVPTGTTCLFVTVAVLLCSNSCTEVSRTCRSTRTDRSYWPRVICSEGCFRASPSTCKPCPSQCVTCKNSTYCTECIDKRWGPTCNWNCTSCVVRNCSNGRCLLDRKKILLAPFTLPVRLLVSRRYIECKSGFTGKQCEIDCALCEKGLCSLNGCIEGCIDGYFSSNYTKSCQKCPRDCISCISLLNCTLCVSGYHGRSCERTCSRFCHNATCEKTTGECTHGCKDHYYKDHLQCVECPHCASCHTVECQTSCCKVTTQPVCEEINCKTCTANNTRFCAECLDGYYVTKDGSCKQCSACISSCCENTTPSFCDVKSCETCKANDPRFCVECSNGSYVTDKEICEPCSQYCTDRTCDPYNGTCLLGCIDGWKGPDCRDSVCANSSCGLYRINQDESGNQDEPEENSMVIVAGIGSAIFVLVVAVIATVILVTRNKRAQQKSNAPVQTEADATDASNYQNITSGSNNRSAMGTINQTTELQTLPETSDYVDVDNFDNAINTYEALGNSDEHFYAISTNEVLGARDEQVYSKSFYEALGPRDEHMYSESSYEALGARDEQAYGTAEEPTYVNKTGVE